MADRNRDTAHDAFQRDLASLARAAQGATRSSPDRQRSVAAGWELFKRQLHLHHTAEDDLIWPALRERLANSAHALPVLDEMEAEHQRIDPLLAAVDAGFASAAGPVGGHPGADRLADTADALAATLCRRLSIPGTRARAGEIEGTRSPGRGIPCRAATVRRRSV